MSAQTKPALALNELKLSTFAGHVETSETQQQKSWFRRAIEKINLAHVIRGIFLGVALPTAFELLTIKFPVLRIVLWATAGVLAVKSTRDIYVAYREYKAEREALAREQAAQLNPLNDDNSRLNSNDFEKRKNQINQLFAERQSDLKKAMIGKIAATSLGAAAFGGTVGVLTSTNLLLGSPWDILMAGSTWWTVGAAIGIAGAAGALLGSVVKSVKAHEARMQKNAIAEIEKHLKNENEGPLSEASTIRHVKQLIGQLVVEKKVDTKTAQRALQAINAFQKKHGLADNQLFQNEDDAFNVSFFLAQIRKDNTYRLVTRVIKATLNALKAAAIFTGIAVPFIALLKLQNNPFNPLPKVWNFLVQQNANARKALAVMMGIEFSWHAILKPIGRLIQKCFGLDSGLQEKAKSARELVSYTNIENYAAANAVPLPRTTEPMVISTGVPPVAQNDSHSNRAKRSISFNSFGEPPAQRADEPEGNIDFTTPVRMFNSTSALRGGSFDGSNVNGVRDPQENRTEEVALQ